jgi:phage FluMu protein Com
MIMHILKHQKKCPQLNTFERFYIHKEAASNNHLSDSQTVFTNKISDTILKIH